RYNVADRGSEAMLDLCEQEDLAFLPYSPIQDYEGNPRVGEVATHHRVTPTQVVLAWLLARSPAMLPIPGTGSVPHLEENVTASTIRLEPGEVAALLHAA